MMKNVMMEILTHEMGVVQVVLKNTVVMGIAIVMVLQIIILVQKSVILERIMVSCDDYVHRLVHYQTMNVSSVMKHVMEVLVIIISSCLSMCQVV